jgi:putative ABC transport system ATP-binding protein
MIQIDNIKYSYPNSDFHLNVEGLFLNVKNKTAVIGPSGFGKTTMLNLIAGILIPDSGKVTVNDKLISSYTETDRRNFRISEIGFVFQDFKLLEYLTVLDNILLPYRINSIMQLDNNAKSNAVKLAKEMSIDDKLNKYPSKLSHGERQRVAICRALLNNPKIILADEPTGNLDPSNKEHIMKILFDYVDTYDSTLITVTHDHALLKGFDEVIDFKDFQN